MSTRHTVVHMQHCKYARETVAGDTTIKSAMKLTYKYDGKWVVQCATVIVHAGALVDLVVSALY
jgi:hypothetical protein